MKEIVIGDIWYNKHLNKNFVVQAHNISAMLDFRCKNNFKFIASGKTHRLDENNTVWETIHKGEPIFRPFEKSITQILGENAQKLNDLIKEVDNKLKTNNMKEITITLNVSEKGERDLNNFITLMGKDNINKKDVKDLWTERNIDNISQGLRQNLLTPKDYFEKPEYDTLKEKCIELECKRLGVDKLNNEQMNNLKLLAGFDYINIGNNNKDNIILIINRDLIYKHIDKVEKELKHKEIDKITEIINTIFDPIAKKELLDSVERYKNKDKPGLSGKEFTIKLNKPWNMGNSTTTANKPIYFAGVDPVETKKVYTEKDIENLNYVISLTQMYMDGKCYAIGALLKDFNFTEIMDKFTEKDKEPRVSILKAWKSV